MPVSENDLNVPTYERVRARIIEDVLSGYWPAGSQITIAQMTERYRVSQMPVREAMQSLRGEGILLLDSHRGARVPQLGAAFVSNMYDVRGAIEAMLARRAAELITDAELRVARELAGNFEAAALEGDSAAALAFNRSLHRHINEIARNPEALQIIEGRANMVYSVRRRFGYGEGRLSAIIEQHRELVDALAVHDGDKASRIVLQHCEEAKTDLLRMIEAAQVAPGLSLRDLA